MRKKLSFESGEEEEVDAESYSRSWYNYSSSDSDWLHGAGGLDGMSDEADVPDGQEPDPPSIVPADCAATTDQPEESPHKGAL